MRVVSDLPATLLAAAVGIKLVKRILWSVLLEVLFKKLHTCFLKIGRHGGGWKGRNKAAGDVAKTKTRASWHEGRLGSNSQLIII